MAFAAIGTFYTASTSAAAVTTDPIRVYSITIKSAGTAAVVTLKNGGSGGTEQIQLNGTINQCTTVTFPAGRSFPAGAYLTPDANTSYVAIDYEKMV